MHEVATRRHAVRLAGNRTESRDPLEKPNQKQAGDVVILVRRDGRPPTCHAILDGWQDPRVSWACAKARATQSCAPAAKHARKNYLPRKEEQRRNVPSNKAIDASTL